MKKTETTKASEVRTWTKAGAMIGAAGFLALGIIPGIYFGSYGTLALINHLMGRLEVTVLLRVATAAGIILGVACVGFLSIVVGSVIGTVAGYAAHAVAAAMKESAPSVESESIKTH